VQESRSRRWAGGGEGGAEGEARVERLEQVCRVLGHAASDELISLS